MKEFSTKWLSFVLLMAQFVHLSSQSGNTGCEVAKMAIDIIEHLYETSTKFFTRNQNFILQRVAYVSDFGETGFEEGGVGIWQMTEQNLEDAKYFVENTEGMNSAIMEALTLDFINGVTNDNLETPTYNALTAFILIQKANVTVPPRAEIELQFNHWKNLTGLEDASGDLQQKFTEGSGILDANEGEGGTECFVCYESPTDLMFLIDESGSISAQEFEKEKEFVLEVLKRFKDSIESGASQVAVIVFEGFVENSTGYTTDYNYIYSHVDGYPKTGGSTNFEAALTKARDVVANDNLSRVSEQAVRKLIFFLTDGISDEKGAAALLKQYPVEVYSIGMTNDTNFHQLNLVATSENYVRIYEGFNDFTADINQILYQTCRIPTVLSGDDVTIAIPAIVFGQTRYLQIDYKDGNALQLTIDLDTTEVIAFVLYVSCSSAFPSAVNNDYQFTASSDQEKLDFEITCPPKPVGRVRRSVDNSASNDTFQIGLAILTSREDGGTNCTANCAIDIDLGILFTELLVDVEITIPRSEVTSSCSNDFDCALWATASENDERHCCITEKCKSDCTWELILWLGTRVLLPIVIICILVVGIFIALPTLLRKFKHRNEVSPAEELAKKSIAVNKTDKFRGISEKGINQWYQDRQSKKGDLPRYHFDNDTYLVHQSW